MNRPVPTLSALLVLTCAALLSPSAALAQTGATTSAQQPVAIQKTTSEVLVDLVVTDKHGKVIKGLTPSDLQVLDNGTPEKITSLRAVSDSVHLTAADLAGAGVAPDLRPQPFNMAVLVFDHLDNPQIQLSARRAADEFINSWVGPNNYAAVYTINFSLFAMTPFTTDKAQLMKATKLLTSNIQQPYRYTTLNAASTAQTAMQLEQQAMRDALTAEQTMAGAGGAQSGAAGSALAQAKMSEMESESLVHAAQWQGAQDTWLTFGGLRALVDSLGSLPGRKEILYFNDYMNVDNDTAFLLQNVINDANRNHVTIYGIDPTGLNLTMASDSMGGVSTGGGRVGAAAGGSDAGQISGAMQGASSTSLRQATTTGTALDFGEMNLANSIANVGYAGRLTAMNSLAIATGGFTASKANDLRPYLQEIASDIDSHYELSYAAPTAAAANGTLHTIVVKVIGHPDWVVRARKGYYALPPGNAPVESFEEPLYNLIAETPAPTDLTAESDPLQFPMDSGLAAVALRSRIPFSDLVIRPATAAEIKEKPALMGRDLLQFDVLEVVKDKAGNVVRTFSQPVEYSLPPDKAPDVLRSFMNFDRATSLVPGDYQVTLAVYQPNTKKGGVTTTTMAVPPADPKGVRVSSVVLVGGVSKLDAKAAPATTTDPLVYQGMTLMPNVTHTIVQGTQKMIEFYFTARVAKGLPAPQLTMKISTNGSLLAAPTAALPPPDANGLIAYVGNLPAEAFPPGTYDVEMEVKAGDQQASSTTQFTITAAK